MGFDVYGYGIRDQKLESIHKGKLTKVLNVDQYQLYHGDIISFVLYLPKFEIQVNQAKGYTVQRISALKNASKSMKTRYTSIKKLWESHSSNEAFMIRKRQRKDRNRDFHLALLNDIKYNDITRAHIATMYENQLFFEANDFIKTTIPEYFS